jgi:hypothetical protein
MSPIMQLISLLRTCLLLALVTGSTSLPAQDGRADTSVNAAVASAAIYPRLNSSSIYERRKALERCCSSGACCAGGGVPGSNGVDCSPLNCYGWLPRC